MNKSIKSLWSFIKLLIKRWVLLLIFYGSLIGAIFTFGIFHIEVPSYVFWILVLIGLFWASFRVYLEQLEKIPTKEPKEPKETKEQKPEVAIELIEGNKYTYRLGKSIPNRAFGKSVLHEASIELHLRISNIGAINVDILSIKSKCETYHPIWDVSPISIPMDKKSKEIIYPRRLGVHEILLCDIESEITPNIMLNDAQFAARLPEKDEDKRNISLKIELEAKDLSGNIHEFNLDTKASAMQLIDLYLTKWQEQENAELLRLARSDTPISNLPQKK